jgi:hypothetical protein
MCAVLLESLALHAAEKCSAEVKMLLSSPIQTTVTSLSFENKTTGQVYFFDTDELDLLKQGVIVRVRQGADNDLTVKVRVPEDNKQTEIAQLRGRFPCEINQTGSGKDTDYSVRRDYKALQLPKTGSDLSRFLSPTQKRLLHEAGVSIDWAQVKRVVDVNVTKWETTAQSPFRKLTLELWEWPEGKILELSTKVAPDAGISMYADLQRLAGTKGLSLSTSQGAKTSTVLGETVTHHASPPR